MKARGWEMRLEDRNLGLGKAACQASSLQWGLQGVVSVKTSADSQDHVISRLVGTLKCHDHKNKASPLA